MFESIRIDRSTLTYVLIGAAAAGVLFYLLRSEVPQMRRYVRLRGM